MLILALILSGIATWRVAYMLVFEEGPGDIFKLLRTLVGVVDLDDGSREEEYGLTGIKKFLAGIFSCIYCMSVWVGAFFAIFNSPSVFLFLVYTLLFSTMAIFINLVHDKMLPEEN